jgi:hypothetical protein
MPFLQAIDFFVVKVEFRKNFRNASSIAPNSRRIIEA